MRAGASMLSLAALLVAGCAHSPRAAEFVGEPAPSPEMAKLGRLVGEWSGTAEFVSPVPVAAVAGPDSPRVAMRGEMVYSWVLAGACLKAAGWHEMPDGRREHLVEYVAWDPKGKTYRAWWFTDTGRRGEGTMTVEGDSIRSTGEGVLPDGSTVKGSAVVTFTGSDETIWSWTGTGPDGETRLEGTMTRRR